MFIYYLGFTTYVNFSEIVLTMNTMLSTVGTYNINLQSFNNTNIKKTVGNFISKIT